MSSTNDVLTIERIFEASVARVWQLWTEPEHFQAWYGPHGATVPVVEIDLRVGGRHLFCMEMETPNGTMRMCFAGEYLEIIPEQKLVYTDGWADEDGNNIKPPMPNTPDMTTVTVLLEDLGDGRTKMRLTHEGVPENSGGASGWNQAFDKLAARLAA